MTLTLLTLLLAAAGFVWGRIRADVVALIALTVLTVGGVITTGEALSGFSNPIVIMMVGLFVVGGAIFNTGLAKMLGAKLVKLGGKSPTRLFLVVVISTGVIGGFVSNTGTVALMLPIVVSMAAAVGMSASRLLMPLAFASSMGGMLTLIGTPPNLVIAEAWEEAGGEPMGMFSFLPVGLICLAAGTVLMIPLSRLLVKGKKTSGESSATSGRSLSEIVEEYGLNNDLWRLSVPEGSPIAGLTLGALALRNNYHLDALELRSGDSRRRLIRNITQETPTASSVIDTGDVIFVRGPKEEADRFAADFGLNFDTHIKETRRNLQFYDIGLAEIIPMPGSKVLKESIADLDFRRRYGVNILCVRRGGKYITDGLPDLTIRKDDVLLVQGQWESIAALGRDKSWVTLGQPLAQASRVTLDYKAPLAGIIMLAMIASLVAGLIPAVMAVIIAGLAMVLTGCFRNVADAYKTINWESIVLIAAMMPMSFALDKTGISEAVSGALVDTLGTLGPMALLAGVFLTTSVMSLFISNTATAVLLAPIAVESATAYGVSALPFLFAVTLGASLSFASPFSTPPNALVMPAGQYTFMDYVKVGLPLQLILGVIMILTLPLLFPF